MTSQNETTNSKTASENQDKNKNEDNDSDQDRVRLSLCSLPTIAGGLNIEGCRPAARLPKGCAWYNLVQVVDEPLKGDTFDAVMERVHKNKLNFIEEAVGISIPLLLNQLNEFLTQVKARHKNVLVHVHQYKGTTKLHEAITERTGLLSILDETNYWETPVDYKTLYPHIDALVSLSQCAGFGHSAGQWILPSSYHTFDVKRSIVFTDPITSFVPNSARLLTLPFKTIQRPLLVVDDLWNPDVKCIDDDGVLVLNAEAARVLSFCKEHTALFDSSHNWEHAVQVALNATVVSNTRAALYLALLHDICDHKYPKALERQYLAQFIHTLPSYLQNIDQLIDQVSFSKEKAVNRDKQNEKQNEKQNDKEKDDDILRAVRDADRLEALGHVGIHRCETFVREKKGVIPDDVVRHCFDKLLRLVPEGWIVSPALLHEARRRHNVIVDYVHQHLSKTSFAKEFDLPKHLK